MIYLVQRLLIIFQYIYIYIVTCVNDIKISILERQIIGNGFEMLFDINITY